MPLLPLYGRGTDTAISGSKNPPDLQRRSLPLQERPARLTPQERLLRLQGNGEFFYVCIGWDNIYCRVLEFDAGNYGNDHDFAEDLVESCRQAMGWLYLLLTMSDCDEVLMKRVCYLDSGQFSKIETTLTFRSFTSSMPMTRSDVIPCRHYRRARTIGIMEKISSPGEK